MVAVGGSPPAVPSRTALLAMSMTTTASGSVKSNATPRPVSTSFGPISGSSNAVSKMPPMYLVTSAELVNPIGLLNLDSNLEACGYGVRVDPATLRTSRVTRLYHKSPYGKERSSQLQHVGSAGRPRCRGD